MILEVLKWKTDDKKRSGRLREVDRDAVVNTVEDHPSMTTRMLSDDFGCSHTKIEKILKTQVRLSFRASLTHSVSDKNFETAEFQ